MAMFDVNEFLKKAVESGASDIHLKVEQPPMIRRNGLILKSELFSDIVLDERFHERHRGASGPLGDGFSVLEEVQGGDAADIEGLCKLGVLVDIDLSHLDRSLVLDCYLRDDRCKHAARSAPGCPEVHQDRQGCLQYFLFEIVFGNNQFSHIPSPFILYL